MIVLLLFSFISGVTTILAPCIWPVLPIVLSSSLAGQEGHRRPLGIVLGIMISFTFFTLFASFLVSILHINPVVFRMIGAGIIVLLGLIMIFPFLAVPFEQATARLARFAGKNTDSPHKSDFIAGFTTGCALGVMWSPCAGPILATIATLAATKQVGLSVILVTLSYVGGVGVPLFIIAYGGKRIIVHSRWINRYTGRFQQIFGVVMILSTLAIFTNYDQLLQLQLINRFPILGSVVNTFETSPTVATQLTRLKKTNTSPETSAIDLRGGEQWFNSSKPLTLADLKGKVVLIDFWTYTCINCLRTLPHLTQWYTAYKDKGLVIIGVHTPEFQFEHDAQNVQRALARYGITYPVVLDNSYSIWNSVGNQYWPAEYLIDAKGVVRRTHFGEGEYDQTESAIRGLIREAGQIVPEQSSTMPDQTPQSQISPETYLGSSRMQYYFPSGSLGNGTQQFSLSENPDPNSFSYGGAWTIADEYATAGTNATLTYNFTASKVFIILRPNQIKMPQVSVFLDGQPITAAQAGSDVTNGTISVDTDRLYSVVDLKGKTESHILKLIFQTPGVEAFTFTFG